MRTFVLSVAAAVLSAASWGAHAAAQTIPQSATFSVTSYGARPGQDSTAAFEAALFAAARNAAAGPGTKTRVFVPATTAPFLVTRTLRLADGVDLVGEGMGLSSITAYGWPAIVIGVDPVAGWRTDCFGVLDASAAPRAGVRRTITTGPDRLLQLQFHDLCDGKLQGIVDWQPGHEHWEKTEILTVDACVAPAWGKPWPEYAPIVGIGRGGNSKPQPSPWFLSKGPAEFGAFKDTVVFAFADERWDDQNSWGCHGMLVGLDGFKPPYRLSFQANLKTGVLAAWVNGQQVPWLYFPTNTGPTKPFEPGHRFVANEDWPFYVGADGAAPAGDHVTPTWVQLAGLHVSAKERYVVGNPGDPQRRADVPDYPVNDAYRYFEKSDADATVGYFPLTDLTSSWTVNVADSRQEGSALWMRGAQMGNKSTTVKDLSVQSIGPTVAVGASFGITFDGCRFVSNESVAIGSWRTMACYPVRVRNCNLAGGDRAYFGFRQIAHFRDVTVERSGRDAFAFRGCYTTGDAIFSEFLTSYSRRFLSFLPEEYAGQHRWSDILIDTEGPGFDKAVIEAWAAPGDGARLLVSNLHMGTTKRPDAPPVPIIKLNDAPLGGQFLVPSRLEVRNVVAAPDYTAIVQSDGPNWKGTVSAPQERSAAPLILYTGPKGPDDSPTGGLVVEEDPKPPPEPVGPDQPGAVAPNPGAQMKRVPLTEPRRKKP